ncbi:hypothetical protein HT102_06705 [Hoyosella sp. G463]|uniref:Uncharacterized protein n=1 Tax=Lolliginicoccus lacisalsi TaxID=2742202 RepID=A0A927JBL9_9ACTN|nr:hypothetical protein [Lolliginicoccus lacisalsi]MBD8506170.1 hypothetical protein [Lolliginicoccus lacisalsi]
MTVHHSTVPLIAIAALALGGIATTSSHSGPPGVPETRTDAVVLAFHDEDEDDDEDDDDLSRTQLRRELRKIERQLERMRGSDDRAPSVVETAPPPVTNEDIIRQFLADFFGIYI